MMVIRNYGCALRVQMLPKVVKPATHKTLARLLRKYVLGVEYSECARYCSVLYKSAHYRHRIDFCFLSSCSNLLPERIAKNDTPIAG